MNFVYKRKIEDNPPGLPLKAVVRVKAGRRCISASYDVRALVIADSDSLMEDYRRERVEVSMRGHTSRPTFSLNLAHFIACGCGSLSVSKCVRVCVSVCIRPFVSVVCLLRCVCVCQCVCAFLLYRFHRHP